MYQLFTNCRKIKTLDLSGWNVSNVENFRLMFSCLHRAVYRPQRHQRPLSADRDQNRSRLQPADGTCLRGHALQGCRAGSQLHCGQRPGLRDAHDRRYRLPGCGSGCGPGGSVRARSLADGLKPFQNHNLTAVVFCHVDTFLTVSVPAHGKCGPCRYLVPTTLL